MTWTTKEVLLRRKIITAKSCEGVLSVWLSARLLALGEIEDSRFQPSFSMHSPQHHLLRSWSAKVSAMPPWVCAYSLRFILD
jgi:hypothetical protein